MNDEIKDLIERLEKKGLTIYDVVKMAVQKWHQSPSLITEVLYAYDDDEVFVSQRSQGEVPVYNQRVDLIYKLEPNWINNEPFDVEEDLLDAGEEEKARKARELLNEGKSEIEVLKEIGEDPVEYITTWIVGNFEADGIYNWEDYFTKR
jgi:hypothetical protein